MYKKGDARASLFFCQSKPIAFSSCSPSPLQKLPIVVIQKFCYHGNMTSHFSSLLLVLLLLTSVVLSLVDSVHQKMRQLY